ncbi:hypothetical protein Tco_0659116 [Tanacetum coccineum]
MTPTVSSKKDQGKKRKLVMESTDAPSPAKLSKAGKVTKKRMSKSSLQLVDKVVDEGVPEKEPAHGDEEANLQRVLELKVQGKGGKKRRSLKNKVAHDLLTIQTPKPKNPADQFIFQRRTPMPTEPSEHADISALMRLALDRHETESKRRKCKGPQTGARLEIREFHRGEATGKRTRKTKHDGLAHTMADMNMPANDVPAKQAPTIAPPTRTDD